MTVVSMLSVLESIGLSPLTNTDDAHGAVAITRDMNLLVETRSDDDHITVKVRRWVHQSGWTPVETVSCPPDDPDRLAAVVRRLIDMVAATPTIPTVTRSLPHDWRELTELNFKCPHCGAVNSIPIMHAFAISENPALSPWYCWKAACRQPFRIHLSQPEGR